MADGYVISGARTVRPGIVAFDVVTDTLQRLAVVMRRDRTTAEQVDATVRQTIAARTYHGKPLR